MAHYRLLAGRHVGWTLPDCKCERCTMDRETLEMKKVTNPTEEQTAKARRSLKGHVYEAGEVVEDSTDLIARFPNKFEMISESGQVIRDIPRRVKAKQPTRSNDVLETMTVEELRKLASEEEIDLGNAVKKVDIIEAIEAVMA